MLAATSKSFFSLTSYNLYRRLLSLSSLCFCWFRRGHTIWTNPSSQAHGMPKALQKKHCIQKFFDWEQQFMIATSLRRRENAFCFNFGQIFKLQTGLLSSQCADSWSWMQNRSSSHGLSIERISLLLFDFHLSLAFLSMAASSKIWP